MLTSALVVLTSAEGLRQPSLCCARAADVGGVVRPGRRRATAAEGGVAVEGVGVGTADVVEGRRRRRGRMRRVGAGRRGEA